MAEDRHKALQELANWCCNQRQSALQGIQFFAERQKHLARLDPEMAEGDVADGPVDHVAGLRQTVKDMDALLAAIDRDAS
jgi:hypothetical protein